MAKGWNVTFQKVTNKWLKDAFNQSHFSYINGLQSHENANTFLRVCGIKEKTRKDILEHADNEMVLMKMNSISFNMEEMEYIHKDYSAHPTNYQKMEYPPTWDEIFDISLQIVALMYTLCLNVKKNTHEISLDFVSTRRKQAPLIVFSEAPNRISIYEVGLVESVT